MWKAKGAKWLVVNDDNVPNFNRNGRRFFANYNWSNNRWHNTAMVAFRDCLRQK